MKAERQTHPDTFTIKGASPLLFGLVCYGLACAFLYINIEINSVLERQIL